MERTSNKESPLVILANDPSICAWGYAVLNANGKILATGCIKTGSQAKKRRIRKGDDSIRRIVEINQTLIKVIKKYKVSYLLSELPHGSQSASAAVMIGTVTGIMQTMADCFEIGVEWYSEADTKRCTLGRISATKGEMIEVMASLMDVPWTGIKYKDEAVADALAVYYTASKQSHTLKMFKRI